MHALHHGQVHIGAHGGQVVDVNPLDQQRQLTGGRVGGWVGGWVGDDAGPGGCGFLSCSRMRRLAAA